MRREIELGVGFAKPTLPVLVGDAVMPPPEALPSEIAALASREALQLRDEGTPQNVEDRLPPPLVGDLDAGSKKHAPPRA